MIPSEHCVYLDFGVLNFYDNYVIGNMYESVMLDEECMHIIHQNTSDYYKEESYVYISNRCMDYSVDPLAYRKVNFSPNLLAIVFVASKDKLENARFEEKFIRKPFRIFPSLEEATEWAENLKKHYRSIR